MLKEEFVNKANSIHSNKYDYSLVVYTNNKTKVEIVCPSHKIFKQTPHNHLAGHGCPLCALEEKSTNQSKTLSDMIDQFNSVHNFKYKYDKVNYINNKTKITVSCSKHGDFNIIPYHHMSGVGCSKCAGNCSGSNEEFIQKSSQIHGDKYDYSMVEYKNNKTKVGIICKKHKIFYQLPYHHLDGHGCPICSSSKGEDVIRNFLERNNIKFTEQKRFDDCKNRKTLPFDFYLDNLKICIEFDGEQHTKKSSYFYTEELNKNDKIKSSYCKDKNINLLRISYKDFKNIEKILEEKIMS